MKVVIVGGVAGGASAAARIRRLDESAEIIIFERSGYVSYANCGLPYYISGVIDDPEELSLQDAESFYSRFRVTVRTHHEITGINAEAKIVSVKNLETGEEFTESYDKLLLSPGAKPTVPKLEGVDSSRIFTLRTVEDTLRIREFVEKNKPASAVLAGGGYIGVEVAENLSELGIRVTVIQRPKHLLAPFDSDMAAFIQKKLREKGIRLMLGHTVEGFSERGDKIYTAVANFGEIEADMVLLAIGVSPDTALAQSAGLKLGAKNSIYVNEHMETSSKDIYAVGDAVEVEHFVTGKKTLIALAGPANKQGRIAADNICGGSSVYRGSQGSSVIKIFDMTAATTGINEKTARAEGIDCDAVILTPQSHAGYYPNAKSMKLKVVFDKTDGRILGAQIVGYDGVDKRIDVLAAAIRFGAKAEQLKELDLAYAPPYSSAKDPVNMAGFAIENIITGKLKQYRLPELEALPEDGSVVKLDTRTVREYSRGHIEGFINIPVDELRERLDELPTGKPVYVICQSGLRSYIACRILTQRGFDCYNFAGGYGFYSTVKEDTHFAESAMPCGMEKL